MIESKKIFPKRRTFIVTTIVVTFVLFLFGIYIETSLNQNQREFMTLLEQEKGNYNEDRIVLSSTTRSEAQTIAEIFGGTLRITEDGSFAVINLPEGMTLEDIAQDKNYRKYHDKICLDYNNFSIMEDETAGDTGTETEDEAAIRANYQVNDPMYPQQTYLDYLNIGDTWAATRGSDSEGEKVTVAIIDTGIDTDHPEFYDSDGNSIISPQSYDATNDKVVDQYDISVIEDTDGHGTGVAGVIAAQMDENGIAGIAPEVELLVIKCEIGEDGKFKSSADIVFGIYYAIEQDADVINMSLGGIKSGGLKAPLQLAVDSDIICIAAAGNEGTSNPDYPAAYDEVIGVGALDDGSWEYADYSNYGINSDIMAPGTVLTTAIGGGYTYKSGTSMSAPMVTAAVALYVSQNQYPVYETVKAELMAAGKDLGTLGEDELYGFGALDIHAFVCEEKGTITYDYCTEEISSTKQVFVRQHTIQTVPEPERENIIFDDWYYDKAYTQVFDYDAWYSTEFVEDITLYAKWVNEDDEDASVYNYRTLSDGTIEIVSYKGKRRYVIIPDEIDGKIVSSIGANAFYGNSRIREITFPENLVYIKKGAFKNVNNMREITFTGTQLLEIQEQAFESCTSLRTLKLPDSVEKIGEYAFFKCSSLTAVSISEKSSLTILNDQAFAETAISYFYLPQNVSANGFNGSVLAYCSNMSSISVHSENSAFTVSDNTLYSADKTAIVYYPAALTGNYVVADGVKEIQQYAFAGASISNVNLNAVNIIHEYVFAGTENISSVVLPDTITDMEKGAFEKSFISQVTLSENLDNISECAFYKTKLTSVHIPAKVVTIYASAFRECSYLKKLTFAEDSMLQTIAGGIDQGAFMKCRLLENFILPESLKTIGLYAFSNCSSITELIIPTNVNSIEERAFQYCTLLQQVDFADDCVLSQISSYCFANCTKLNIVNFSDGITKFGQYAFSNDYLLSALNFGTGSNLTTIGDYCFYSCSSLQMMQLPETIITIGQFAYAFSGLTQVDITENVASIGNGAFGACYVLTEINVDQSNSFYTVVDNVLFNKDITVLYCVPASRTGSYTLPETVTVTAPYSFYYDISLTEVILPDSLEDIQQNSFYKCSGLTSIKIPANVTNIGREAFKYCYELVSVTLGTGSKLQRLGIYTFVNCGVSEITIPASVEEIAQYVFYNCGDLKKITFEENSKLSYISAYMFKGTKVESIIFEKGSALTSIQAHAFDGATYLKSVDFGDAQITNIDNYAFYNCAMLEEICIPDTVTYIGRYAFYGCAKLNRIDIPETMDYIGESAFYGTNNIKVFFAADELPANVQNGWDKGIAGYFLGTVDYVITDEWEYSVSKNGTIALVTYKGSANELILDTVDGYTISKIGARCFYNNDTLTSITLSENIVEIGNYAFSGCDALTALTVPASVKQIGSYAFADSAVVIEFSTDSMLEIVGDYAFSKNATKSLVLPDGVVKMGDGVFYEGSLSELTIGENSSLQSIGQQSFVGSGISSIYLPASLENVGAESFKNVSTLTTVKIAEGDTALKLANSAFEGSGITEIDIPARVFYIGEYTFGSCPNLENISVDSENEFYISLNGVLCDVYGTTLIQYPSGRVGAYEVPKQIKVLSYASFKNTKNLTEVTFAEGSSVKTIGWQTFSGCENLKKITVPDTVVSFDFYAFENCINLADVILSENTQLSGIYEGAFYNCSALVNISLPDTIVEISDYAFYKCVSLTVFPLAENALVKGIYDYAFYGCTGITEIPDFSQLVEIGEYAFAYTGISEYTIPATVKDIASNAFYGCENFSTIYCDDSNETYTAINGALYEKGADSVDDWDALVIWPYGNSIVIGEDKTVITSADTATIRGISGMEISVSVADTVTSIDAKTFYRCTSIRTLTIPESVTSIGEQAFYGCTGLENIVLSENLITIEKQAFYGCTELSSIILPENLTTIGEQAFYGCNGLSSIVLPESITTIGSNAFAGCSIMVIFNGDELPEDFAKDWLGSSTLIMQPEEYGTTDDGYFYCIMSSDTAFLGKYSGKASSAVIPETIKGVPVVKLAGTFYNCTNLQTVMIPDNVTVIGDYTFYNCSSLKDIDAVLPNSVTDIGAFAYYGCNFKEITIPENVKHIGNSAFYITKYGSTGFEKINFNATDMEDSTFRNNIFGNAWGIDSNAIVTIGSNVIRIPAYIFNPRDDDDNLVGELIFEEGSVCESIGCAAFSGEKGITRVVFPDSVLAIEKSAFSNCQKLSEVYFSKNLREIGEDSFYKCNHLTDVVIPENVYYIDSNAFLECSNLNVVYIDSEKIAANITSATVSGDLCNYADTIAVRKDIETVGSYITDNFTNIEDISFSEQDYAAYSKQAHEWSEGNIVSEYTECQQDGITIYTCNECGICNEIIVPAHDLQEQSRQEATCLEDGWIESCCSRCQKVVRQILPMYGRHIYGDWYTVTEDSEGSPGLSRRDCKYCDQYEEGSFTTIASGDCGYRMEWILSGDGTLMLSGKGKMDKWDSYSEVPWYSYCTEIIKVEMDEAITGIGNYAFYNCSNLSDIVISENVTLIGKYTFYGCSSLTEIVLPEGITDIEIYTFYGCTNLTDITIPDNVTSIDYNVFTNCSSLQSVVIPSNVTYISYEIFLNCTSLTSVILPEGIHTIYISAFKNCSSLVNITIPETVTTIEEEAFRGCSSLTSIEIPSGVKYINEYAFYGCENLLSFIIPDEVTRISEGVFMNCYGITDIEIPKSVTQIGAYAFSGCKGLTDIIIPDKLTLIGTNAFYSCSNLKSVYIDDLAVWCKISFQNGFSNPLYGEAGLYLNGELITNLEIPESVTNIGNSAFYGYEALESVTIPENVTSVGTYTFSGCTNLTEVTFESDTSDSVSKYAFSGCTNLTEIAFNGNAPSIVDTAFYNVSAKALYPMGNETWTSDFLQNYGGTLTWLAVCDEHNWGEWYVSEEADCASPGKERRDCQICEYYEIKEIENSGIGHSYESVVTEPTCTAKGYTTYTCSVCGYSYMDDYTEALGHSEVNGICERCNLTVSGTCGTKVTWQLNDEGVLTISGTGAMINYSYSSAVPWYKANSLITSVKIESGVTSIGNYAFYYCSNLAEVTIPDTVSVIGNCAFYYCSSLQDLSIPSSVKTISGSAFYNCSNLSNLYISNLSSWMKVTFGNSSSNPMRYADNTYVEDILLTDLTVPSDVAAINAYAFYGCSNLKNITISEAVTKIGSDAFGVCSNLENLYIVNLDTWCNISFGSAEANPMAYVDNIYVGNTLLTNVKIPEGVGGVGDYAFYGCKQLEEISLPDDIATVGKQAFKGCSKLVQVAIPAGVTTISSGAFAGCSSLIAIEIPKGVTSIASELFYECTSLTEVNIPNSVTSIGNDAFRYCNSLVEVIIPDSVTSIGRYAFNYCTGLTSIVIPDSITVLSYDAFGDCTNLKSVIIPDSVITIEDYVFAYCKALTSVTIPSSVTSIGDDAFRVCSALKEIKFLGDAPSIGTSDTFYGVTANCYYSEDAEGWTSNILQNYGGTLTWNAIHICEYSAEMINVLAATCTETGYSGDLYCNSCEKVLKSGCEIPALGHNYSSIAVEPTCMEQGYTIHTCSICNDSYMDNYVDASGHDYEDGVCVKCGTVYVPPVEVATGYSGYTTWILTDDGTLTVSGEGAMKNYTSKTAMPWYEYADQITSVVLEDGVTTIGNYAFYGMPNLQSIEISESVTIIGEYAFKNDTALESIKLPSALTKIGDSAFFGCSALTSINIPEGIYTIWAYTFKNCSSLAKVELPSTLIKIDEAAFYGTALTELVVPDNVSVIGIYCFKNCSKLASVTLPAKLTQIREAVFYGTSITSLDVPDEVTGIGPYAFKNCTELAALNLPETLSSIGEAAFYGSSISELVIPDAVSSIDSYAFKNCTNLETVDLPTNLEEISEAVFYNCSKLKKLVLPDKVTTIGNYAFRKCSGLESIVWGSGLTTIGESSFYGCEGLSTLSLPEGVTTIEGYAFKSCTGLTEVNLPKSLIGIGESAFYACTKLTGITVPANVDSISAYAFSRCTGLTEVEFLGNAPSIGSGAFSKVVATVYYSADTTGWTEDVMQNYGGTITWVSVRASSDIDETAIETDDTIETVASENVESEYMETEVEETVNNGSLEKSKELETSVNENSVQIETADLNEEIITTEGTN